MGSIVSLAAEWVWFKSESVVVETDATQYAGIHYIDANCAWFWYNVLEFHGIQNWCDNFLAFGWII